MNQRWSWGTQLPPCAFWVAWQLKATLSMIDAYRRYQYINLVLPFHLLTQSERQNCSSTPAWFTKKVRHERNCRVTTEELAGIVNKAPICGMGFGIHYWNEDFVVRRRTSVLTGEQQCVRDDVTIIRIRTSTWRGEAVPRACKWFSFLGVTTIKT